MKVSDHIANIISKKTSIVFGGQGSSVIHLVDSIIKHKKLTFISGKSLSINDNVFLPITPVLPYIFMFILRC